MIVAGVEVENFGPFRGRHFLDLDGVHAFAIIGANGQGKSALLDAPGYALYGRTRSRSASEWLHRGASDMRVALTLRGDGPDILVERGWRERNGVGKGWVKVAGWEGAQGRHARRDAVERALGLEWDDYLGTRCITQGDLQRLGTSDPGARRALVEKWLARPIWARAAGHLAARRVEAKRAVDRAEAAREAAHRAHLRAQLALDQWAKRPPDVVVEREAAHAAAALALVEADRPAEPPELDGLDGDVKRAAAALADARKAASDFDGNCPVLDQPCPVADRVRADTDALQRRRATAEETWRLAAVRLADARATWKAVERDWERRQSVAATVERATREALVAHRAADAAVAQVQEEHAATEVERDDANEWLLAFEARLGALAAAARGIEAVAAAEVEEAVDEAERHAGDVLRALGCGLGVRFAHDRELREWAPACATCGAAGRPDAGECRLCGAPWPRARRPELDLVVETPEGDRPFECVGGGQRDLVSLALRLAFGRGVGALRVVLCDEVLRQLDRANREAAAQYLMGGGVGALGVDQVWLVSHDAGAVAAAPRLLQVVPDEGGGSRLEWLR